MADDHGDRLALQLALGLIHFHDLSWTLTEMITSIITEKTSMGVSTRKSENAQAQRRFGLRERQFKCFSGDSVLADCLLRDNDTLISSTSIAGHSSEAMP